MSLINHNSTGEISGIYVTNCVLNCVYTEGQGGEITLDGLTRTGGVNNCRFTNVRVQTPNTYSVLMMNNLTDVSFVDCDFVRAELVDPRQRTYANRGAPTTLSVRGGQTVYRFYATRQVVVLNGTNVKFVRGSVDGASTANSTVISVSPPEGAAVRPPSQVELDGVHIKNIGSDAFGLEVTAAKASVVSNCLFEGGPSVITAKGINIGSATVGGLGTATTDAQIVQNDLLSVGATKIVDAGIRTVVSENLGYPAQGGGDNVARVVMRPFADFVALKRTVGSAVNGMSLAVAAGDVWIFRGSLNFDASQTAGARIEFAFPGSSTLEGGLVGPVKAAGRFVSASVNHVYTSAAPSGIFAGAGAGTMQIVTVSLRFQAGSTGRFVLNFSQAALDATIASTLRASSWLLAQKL
jgi:hypothetical protein